MNTSAVIKASDDPAVLGFDSESLRCEAALPTTLLLSSRDAGWDSVLMELHRVTPRAAAFETHPTSDQTIVLGWRSVHEIQSRPSGRWRGRPTGRVRWG